MNLLQNILNIDKSTKMIHMYHKSNKAIIPLIIPCYILKDDDSIGTKVLQTTNILNIGYHSYFSMSCIIGDYVNPKNLNMYARIINLKSHKLASLGLIYFCLNI